MKLSIQFDFTGESEDELVGEARIFMRTLLDQGFFDRLLRNGKAGLEVTSLKADDGPPREVRSVRAEILKEE